MKSTAEFFDDAYSRDDVAYGEEPSAPLAAYLDQTSGGGRVFDLAAGAGRDTIALAKAGYQVTSIDLSPEGLKRIEERAKATEVDDLVETVVGDVRDVNFPIAELAGVVATTMLDHIPSEDSEAVFASICASLAPNGFIYLEVHTTEDPGSPTEPGCSSNDPVSDTADAVVNYFAPNQLIRWALRSESDLRVLQYSERQEWDYTHGPEHKHGKAILLAVRSGAFPNWYGQPAAFPRFRTE